MLQEAMKEAKLTEEINSRRNELAKKCGQCRLDVYFWEENWKMVKMCQMFLYQVSPFAWRAKHDKTYQFESKKIINSFDTVDIFSRYKVSEAASLEDLIGDCSDSAKLGCEILSDFKISDHRSHTELQC